ncbi:prepilin peptidase, partial [Candidatus Saccharibacteria bacterium]|nr:prepilin peptidase [Candidatus Saccharibacteria bacterium]
VMLRGKCRYCHKRIGWFEPLMEVGVALFFVVSYTWWPYELTTVIAIAQFILWLVCGVGLVLLLAYDAKWFLLPDVVVFPLMGLACVSAVLTIIGAESLSAAIVSIIGSLCILSGLYFVLYIVSKGAWVGFGDIKLGIVLALLLADWKLALLALFLANVIGMMAVLPGMLSKKLTRSSHVPFGPMLIGGWLLAGLFGNSIINWYFNLVLF